MNEQGNPFEFIRVRSDQWDGLQADLRAKDTLIIQLQGEVERWKKESELNKAVGDGFSVALNMAESEVTRLTTLLEKAKEAILQLRKAQSDESTWGGSRFRCCQGSVELDEHYKDCISEEAFRLLEGKQ